MGIVVPFRAPAGRRSNRRREPHVGGAEILLFTGVRYERYGTAAPAGGALRQPRRRA